MILLWAFVALASPPDGNTALIPLGSGAVEGLVVSADGSLAAGFVDGEIFVLDIDDWSTSTSAPCTVTAAAVGDRDVQGQDLWVGCSDGTIAGLRYEAGVLSGSGVSLDSTRGSSDGIYFVTYDEGGLLYLVGKEIDTDGLGFSVIDPASGLFDADLYPAYPLIFASKQFVVATLDLTGRSELMVAHGGDDVSTIRLDFVSVPAINNFTVSSVQVTDIAADRIGGMYAVDASAGSLSVYAPTAQQFTVRLTGLSDPTAITANNDPDDEWIYVAGPTHEVYTVSGGTPDPTPVWSGSPVSAEVVDLVTGPSGYVIGGTADGQLMINSANPWIDAVTMTPAAAVEGDEVALSFSVSEAVDWALYLGGDHTGTGTKLANGSTDGAGELSATFTVDGSYDEGRNLIYVVATDNKGNSGHAAGALTVDNPPKAVALAQGDLGFADRGLILSFQGLRAADIARYDVYVMASSFEPTDWPTGGPAFDGPDALEAPLSIEATAGETVTTRIEPLSNNTVYYVAVRAIDAGGLEGPMSNVISESPQPSYSASQLAGGGGGYPCTSGPRSGGWLALGLVGLLGGLRRWRGVLAVACLLLPLTASAGKKREDRKDLTEQRGDFELRYGSINLVDSNIKQVYGSRGNNILQLEAGPQFWRFLEFDFGFAFFQELATKVSATGDSGAEKTMLTWYPLSLDTTLRAQFLDEQFLVPYVRYGLDYVAWNEQWDNGSSEKSKRTGAQVGNHWGWGVAILLDGASRERASLLEAQTGINDTYLVIEWRKQFIDNRKLNGNVFDTVGTILSRKGSARPFEFDGTMVTLGLKLDY